MTFAERIAAVMRDVGPLVTDSRNQQQRYDYTSAASALRKIQRALATHGVWVAEADAELVEWRQMQTKSSTWDVAVIRQRVVLTDGETTITATAYGSGADAGDKHLSKAETQSYKYALCKALAAALNAGPEEDERTDSNTQGAPDVSVQARAWTAKALAKAQTEEHIGKIVERIMRAPADVQAELMEAVEKRRQELEEVA